MEDDRGIMTAKVVILGASGVGKTALSVRYCENTFSTSTKSTIGACFLTKNVTIDNVRLKLQLWDTAGQERFRSLAPMYYRGASAAVLVFDVTDSDSFQRSQDWVAVLVVVGNKIDLKQRAVSKDKGKEFADTIKATYVETSAKDGEGVLQLFNDICRKVISQRKQYFQYIPPSSQSTPEANYVLEYESKKKQNDEIKLCCE